MLGLVGAIVAASAGDTLSIAFWGLVNLLLTVVGIFWVQGAVVEAVRDVRDGTVDTSIADLYRATRPRLPALVVAGVLAGLGIALGFVLLVVPGLYLLTRWAVIVPVIILEQRSSGESFGRSWELTRGHGWSVFGVVVATVVASALASSVIGGIFRWLPDFFAAWIGSLVSNSLVVPFVALAWTVMYYRLREARDEREPAVAASPG